MNINIPAPQGTEERPSDLTQQEMADLSAAKRGTILYERMISIFEARVLELNGRIDSLVRHNDCLIAKDGQHQEELRTNGALRRSAVETAVSFALATVFMTIGGALISSFPIADGNPPWQFVLGWTAIVSALIFGFTSRVLVWLVIRIQGIRGDA